MHSLPQYSFLLANNRQARSQLGYDGLLTTVITDMQKRFWIHSFSHIPRRLGGRLLGWRSHFSNYDQTSINHHPNKDQITNHSRNYSIQDENNESLACLDCSDERLFVGVCLGMLAKVRELWV